MDITKTSEATREFYKGRHRFEHWFRDNQIYFITARCRGKFNGFASDEAKHIFWSYLEKLANEHDFALIIALELKAFLSNVPYARYDRKRSDREH
jgi:hypothetical protein